MEFLTQALDITDVKNEATLTADVDGDLGRGRVGRHDWCWWTREFRVGAEDLPWDMSRDYKEKRYEPQCQNQTKDQILWISQDFVIARSFLQCLMPLAHLGCQCARKSLWISQTKQRCSFALGYRGWSLRAGAKTSTPCLSVLVNTVLVVHTEIKNSIVCRCHWRSFYFKNQRHWGWFRAGQSRPVSFIKAQGCCPLSVVGNHWNNYRRYF